MAKEKFEVKLFLKTETYGEFAPILLQMRLAELTISARVSEDKEPDPKSLQLIRDIDEFLHQTQMHERSKDCDNPEKIRFFLNFR